MKEEQFDFDVNINIDNSEKTHSVTLWNEFLQSRS